MFPNLRYRADDQGIHAHLGVVRLLLAEPGVDHVVDAVDCEGGLGDVGRHNRLREG